MDTAKGGYVRYYWPEHPLAIRNNWVPEHHLVAWQDLSYPDWFVEAKQRQKIVVHHIDGIIENTEPSNLQVLLKGNLYSPTDHPEHISESAAADFLIALGWKVEKLQ